LDVLGRSAMSRSVLSSMTTAERLLVAEISRAAIVGLDEEEQLALPSGIQRARSKSRR
jgi:hypothetical protein